MSDVLYGMSSLSESGGLGGSGPGLKHPILRFTYGVAMNSIDKSSLYNQANVATVEKP